MVVSIRQRSWKESRLSVLMTTMVLDNELKQMQWAGKELQKCIGVLESGYAEMSDYIADNFPGFFAAPETQVPTAEA